MARTLERERERERDACSRVSDFCCDNACPSNICANQRLINQGMHFHDVIRCFVRKRDGKRKRERERERERERPLAHYFCEITFGLPNAASGRPSSWGCVVLPADDFRATHFPLWCLDSTARTASGSRVKVTVTAATFRVSRD